MADIESQRPNKMSKLFSRLKSTEMAETRAHVVPMPYWSKIVGTARVVIAFLVLVFAAAATAIFGGFAAFGFTIFTACATLLIFGYYFLALDRKIVPYDKWAVLGLEIFGVIFWAVSFSLCAEWTAAFNWSFYFGGGNYDSTNTKYGFWNADFDPSDIGLVSRGLTKRSSSKWTGGVACAGVASGLGAIEFVLFVLTLVIFGRNLHKLRLAGATSAPGPAVSTSASATAPAPATAEKSEEASVNVNTEGNQPQVLRKESNSVV